MTRLFDDEQSSSLITSMMNPESNATKFMEQGEDIGLPRDVTMDILNKYATYGANTGIGNIGGERLVNALNEEYRKRVDEPLQQMTGKAMAGDYAARIAEQLAEQQRIADALAQSQQMMDAMPDLSATATETAIATTPEMQAALDDLIPNLTRQIDNTTLGAAEQAIQEAVDDPSKTVGQVNSPVTIAGEKSSRFERFEKYLKDNPEVARILEKSGTDVAKIIGQAIGGRDKDRGRTPFRAPRPRFQPSQVRTQRIGMAAGGKPEEGSVLNRKLFIQGGEVDGPGGPKEDLVPIWASDQEYVVSHKGVKNMGGGDFEKGIAALDKINFGKS
jgi:hypothetical protein